MNSVKDILKFFYLAFEKSGVTILLCRYFSHNSVADILCKRPTNHLIQVTHRSGNFANEKMAETSISSLLHRLAEHNTMQT
jgi:fatty-acid desaturase